MKLGLALSGGGYRAAGFHLGTLRKFHELNLLDKLDVLSTISGGSITGACFCCDPKPYPEFEKEMIQALTSKNVISYILRSWEFLRTLFVALLFLGLSLYLSFTRFAPFAIIPVVVLIVILILFQYRLFPVAQVIERAYDKFFFSKKALTELCERPKIAIGSTNLQSGRPFTFSRDRMGDSSYDYAKPPVKFKVDNFPIARAVMASSCVPFAFSPVYIDGKYFVDSSQFGNVDPKLVDGGVYDNQGIHKLTEEKSEYSCDVVVISDAGNKLPFEKRYNNTFTVLLRTVNVFMLRIKNFQMVRNVYENPRGNQIAYISIGWDLDRCISGFVDNLKSGKVSQAIISAHLLDPEWVKAPDTYMEQIMTALKKISNYSTIAASNLTPERLDGIRNIGTNLTCLPQGLIEDMITHSANMTEIQLRLYCPSLFSQHEQ